MKAKAKIEALREHAANVSMKIQRIEAEERVKKAMKLVGKCFRYRNCYSCPKSDADYWWMYQRVTHITATGWLHVFTFQFDRDGKFWVEPKELRHTDGHLGESITLRQFQHAWRISARMLNDRARGAKAYCP